MPHIHDKYDFTVSFFLIHRPTKTICLHYHRKLHFWNQLGGHIELNEHPLDTIKRELLEEAGLRPEQYTIIETFQQPQYVEAQRLPVPFAMPLYKYGDVDHWHIDLPYIIETKTQKITPQEGESTEIDWFSRAQVKKMQVESKLGDTIYEFCEWIFENHM